MKRITRQLVCVLGVLFACASHAAEPLWIDVRSAGEYEQGHLEGAILIPHGEIEQGVAALDIDRDTTLYLYCRSGNRSGKAKARLEAAGYTRVINVGGLEDARSFSRQLLACAEQESEECPAEPPV